jgi:hypothetical protein
VIPRMQRACGPVELALDAANPGRAPVAHERDCVGVPPVRPPTITRSGAPARVANAYETVRSAAVMAAATFHELTIEARRAPRLRLAASSSPRSCCRRWDCA